MHRNIKLALSLKGRKRHIPRLTAKIVSENRVLFEHSGGLHASLEAFSVKVEPAPVVPAGSK
jgi:hypothetical protein